LRAGRRVEEARAPDARVLHEQLGRELAAAAHPVPAPRHLIALDRELAVLDLGEAGAALVVLAVLIDGDAPLERERDGRGGLGGQRVDHPLPPERAALEDRDGPALERAARAVLEARHAK